MAKSKVNKQRKQIKRTTRHFQLRVDHPKDIHVRDVLDYARSQRREVTLIRDAVTLFWALENGNIEAIFEFFPQYKAQFAPNTAQALEQFMQILERQQSAQAQTSQPAVGPKQIAAPTFAMPVFEDDDAPTVLVSTTASTDSSLNFVTALRSMQ